MRRDDVAGSRAGRASCARVGLAWAVLVCVPGQAGAQDTLGRAASCSTPPGPGASVVAGLTRDASSGMPVGFAMVRLLNVVTGDSLRTRVNLRGEFVLCSVPEGAWRVDAWVGNLRAVAPLQLAAGVSASVILDLAAPRTTARSGTLSGRVLDAESGSSVPDATVEVVGTRRRTLTDADGAFSFPYLSPGDVPFRVTTMGYAQAEGHVAVVAGQVVEVEVKLANEAIALAPIMVTVARPLVLPALFAELEQRVTSGWGQFLLEDEIRQRAPQRLTELLDTKGVAVLDEGRRIRIRSTGCAPEVYVDGMKVTGHTSRSLMGPPQPLAEREAADAVNASAVLSVHAVEVYRGPAETPSRYLGTGAACGVILIWTKR